MLKEFTSKLLYEKLYIIASQKLNSYLSLSLILAFAVACDAGLDSLVPSSKARNLTCILRAVMQPCARYINSMLEKFVPSRSSLCQKDDVIEMFVGASFAV